MRFISVLLPIIFLQTAILSAHEIKPLAYFTLMGNMELRERQGISEPVLFSTMNHEGGMKVRVVEVGHRETINEKKGQWIHIITTKPIWVNTWEWIDVNRRFWIFLEDGMDLIDYEE